MKKIFLFIFLTVFAFDIYANCDGIIVNNSNKPWSIRFHTYKGNVYFTGGLSCPMNGPCVLPAHSRATIEYTTAGGISSGKAYVKDHEGYEQNYIFSNSIFSSCPDIRYNVTKKININSPKTGSYEIVGDGLIH